MARKILKILRVPLLAYLGLLLILAGCQRHLIYYPSRATEQRLLTVAGDQGMEPWRNDNGDLIGWKTRMPASAENEKAILVFHGNAGYALHRDYFARGFEPLGTENAWRVYLMEYPGYGARPGKPSEPAFHEAAKEALTLLHAENDGRPLIVVGESLGGGVASRLAADHPDKVDGLILITPFTSLADVGKHHYPFFPVGLMLRDRYDNVDALTHYEGPVAFLLAEHDEVVPRTLGEKLYEGYRGPKHLRLEKGGSHNTLPYHPQAAWWQEFRDFFNASFAEP